MTVPFVPTQVVREWMQAFLLATPAVVSAVGAANIYPNLNPGLTLSGPHLTHSHGGPNGNVNVMPMRGPIAQVGMFWDITAWNPGYGQTVLAPVLKAVMAALIGADTKGKMHRHIDTDQTYWLDCQYAGTEVVPVEESPSGAWAPIRERYGVTLRPVA